MSIKNSDNMILLGFKDVLSTYKSEKHGFVALTKYKYWFPIRKSPALAGIVADLMGDGHLQDDPKLRLDYCSKSKNELKRFNQEIFNLFGINGKIRDCKTNIYKTMNLGVNNKPLARILKLLGVPTGAKVFKEFSVPRWILDDKKLFARFLNRLFSCEGSVDLKSKYIEIGMFKSVDLIDNGIFLFYEIKNHMEKYFNIYSTNPFLKRSINLRKDGRKTKGVILKIKKKDSLLNFQRHVGFDDKNKMRRLNQIISSSESKVTSSSSE